MNDIQVPRYSEQQLRTDLAALYRMVAHFKMTDLVDTHISARVPGQAQHFLINTYGVQFHQMTSRDLVKINHQGESVEPEGGGRRINVAGFVIHSAIHMARPDLQCVIHTHTPDGIAVACMEQGLLPISQHALKFYQRIGYHEYEGIALDIAERRRLVANLGRHQAMILRNHGLLVAGRSIPEAFLNLMYLERACQIQVKATASGRQIHFPQPQVCEKTARQYEQSEGLEHASFVWDAMLKLL